MADAYARLMADFSQMTAWGRGLESDLSWARVEISFLKAEVERLRKAGDAMAETILKDCIHKNDIAALKWYAAKEGKQP